MTTASATAWYVYGVIGAASDSSAADDVHGVGVGRSVRLVERGALAAIVSEVPLAEFGEAELPDRLNDRAWLEQNARAHEDVLRAFALCTALVPLRFGAIYRELADIAETLEVRAEAFGCALERVRGKVELGVKAWADRGRLSAAPKNGEQPPRTGRSYLEQRLVARAAAEGASARLARIVREAHDSLLAHAIDGAVNRPQPRELTGRREEMVLNGVYLVDELDTAFVPEVGRLDAAHRDEGVTFELTGPWAPYNFVDLDLEADPS